MLMTAQFRRAVTGCALALTLTGIGLPAHAFDLQGFKTRLDTTKAEIQGSSLADPKATIARLNEMIATGKTGAKEYAARQPKFARLMEAAVADADAMASLTDAEIEDKWGEQGTAGNAVGIPLKTLGQFDETRAYLELMVSPAHAEIFVKKYATTHKPALVEKTRDELAELREHLKEIH